MLFMQVDTSEPLSAAVRFIDVNLFCCMCSVIEGEKSTSAALCDAVTTHIEPGVFILSHRESDITGCCMNRLTVLC